MTSHQKTLLALSRLPRKVRFVSLGRLNRPLTDLHADIRSTGCSFVEAHYADGAVRGFAPQDLATLREAIQSAEQPAFLIAFTSEQHASLSLLDPRPNLYAALEADEELASSPEHQPRFLAPQPLRDRLHAHGGGGLHPDDYAHRLKELDAAADSTSDEKTADRIRRFRNSAAKYLVAAETDRHPEGKFWTTDPDYLREDATRMPCEVLPCPEIAAPLDSCEQPPSSSADGSEAPVSPAKLAHPMDEVPTPKASSNQFTLPI